MYDRLPPFDAEAEEAVLVACMVDPEAMIRAAALLAPGDFFRAQNAEVFAAELRVNASGSHVNLITVSHELSQKNELEKVGGMSGLAAMQQRSPGAFLPGSAVESYALIVKADATRRALIQSLSGAMASAYEPGDVETLLAETEAALNRVRSGRRDGGRGMGAAPAMVRAYDEMAAFLDDPKRLRGYRTPWQHLNYLLDGQVPGRLITWGAATSVGKSLAVQNITRDLCLAGVPVLMFTTEMTPEEVMTRLAYMEACVDPFVVRRRGYVHEDERERVARAAEVVKSWPLRLEPGEQTPASIRAKSRLYRELMGVAVVIVDHMGQGFVKGEGEKETERIGSVTAGLKNLAADEDLVVHAVSHVNRDSRRENRLLELRDLYMSSHIEQDSSQVVLLTPVEMQGDTPKAMTDHEATLAKAQRGGVDVWFSVAKNRFGGTGGMELFLSWTHHGGRFIHTTGSHGREPESEEAA